MFIIVKHVLKSKKWGIHLVVRMQLKHRQLLSNFDCKGVVLYIFVKIGLKELEVTIFLFFSSGSPFSNLTNLIMFKMPHNICKIYLCQTREKDF